MIVLDLETVAIDNAGEFVSPVSAPANYKDPDKIAAYIADAQREQLEKAAIDPFLARVVCIGTIDADGTERVITCSDEVFEAQALKHLARAMAWPQDERFEEAIVGFNILDFDLVVLKIRAMLLGVKFPDLNLDRFRSPHEDLLQVLTQKGKLKPRSLHWYCRRFGIPVEDATTGKDIAGFVAAGDWEAVRAHNLSDLRLTKALAERMGVIKGGRVAA